MMRRAVLAFLYIIPPFVLADGYPKESPDTLFNTGTGSLTGGGNGNGGYPPVSTDYESRYRGPVAMLMVLPDGHIAETAEVTSARAAHLAALDKAKVLWTQAGSAGGSGGLGQGGSDGGYSYPQPETNSLGSGSNGGMSYLPPQEASGGASGPSMAGASAALSHMPYNGPLAMLMVLPDGHIADTAEVTAARAAHLAALEKAKALRAQSGAGMGHAGSSGASAGGSEGYNYPQPASNSLGGEPGSDQSYLPPQGGVGGSGQAQGGASSAAAGSKPYSGPLAMLTVLPSGYLADTSDIAALRAAHLSALLKAQAAWKH